VKNRFLYHSIPIFIFLISSTLGIYATDISDNSFLITKINSQNLHNQQIWNLLQRNGSTGIEIDLTVKNKNVILQNSSILLETVLDKLYPVIEENPAKIIPVFIKFNDNIFLLDSIINGSKISTFIFYLPQGETWPSQEYLVQANRRIIFFIDGNYIGESRILHQLRNYVFEISAVTVAGKIPTGESNEMVNQELFIIKNFEKLPTQVPPNQLSRNLVPDYINFLLENWKKYGKRPNFIFIGNEILNFDFIVDQLNSFTWIKGVVKNSDKNFDKVFWKNHDILFTGGKFSFPYRGGEELILSPFVPGFKMTPEQIVVTGEMTVPESYTILAAPLKLNEDMTGSFSFESIIMNAVNSSQNFEGENYSYIQDIARGNVFAFA
jgi:hypothetical protein